VLLAARRPLTALHCTPRWMACVHGARLRVAEPHAYHTLPTDQIDASGPVGRNGAITSPE